jgi:hypothetical protein
LLSVQTALSAAFFDPRFHFFPLELTSFSWAEPAINKMLLALAHQLQVEADDKQPLPLCHRLKKRFMMLGQHSCFTWRLTLYLLAQSF